MIRKCCLRLFLKAHNGFLQPFISLTYMESKAKFLGHPLHQILVVFPLGLLATATAFDGIGGATKNRKWYEASYYMIGAGVAVGLVTAVPGVIDFLAIPQGTRAKRVGLLHGVGNLFVTAMFAASWKARRRRPSRPTAGALTTSATATLLALVTAWLGGELVDRLTVGVDEGAHLDAPSSLRVKQIPSAEQRHDIAS
jgi:uncharacterized membrane protein